MTLPSTEPTSKQRHEWLEEARRRAAIDGNEDITIKARDLAYWLDQVEALEAGRRAFGKSVRSLSRSLGIKIEENLKLEAENKRLRGVIDKYDAAERARP